MLATVHSCVTALKTRHTIFLSFHKILWHSCPVDLPSQLAPTTTILFCQHILAVMVFAFHTSEITLCVLFGEIY